MSTYPAPQWQAFGATTGPAIPPAAGPVTYPVAQLFGILAGPSARGVTAGPVTYPVAQLLGAFGGPFAQGGSVGPPPAPPAGCYYPPGYFPPGYYPPGYFPGSGTPAQAAAIAADLVDAVEGYLNSTFVGTGRVTWAGAGKLPPGFKLPFIVVGDPDETPDYQEDGSQHPPYDDDGDLPIRVVAPTRSQAKALSAAVAKALTRASLTFADGTLLSILRTARSAPVCEGEDAPDGDQVWIAFLMFHTITAKNL